MTEINTRELDAMLQSMNISKKACARSLYRLDDVLNALDKYTEAAIADAEALQSEGATESELTRFNLMMVRLRNATVVKYCDLI